MRHARSGRLLLVGALVAGLGAVLLWWVGLDPSGNALERSERSPLTPEAGATLDGPVLEGLPDIRERPAPAQQPWILEVRVRGLPAAARPPLKVSVMPGGGGKDREDYEIHAVEDETAGWTEFDVTDVLGARPQRLRVRAQPRDAFSGTTVVELPTDEETRLRGGRLLAEITAEPAAVLEGRVVNAVGQPVQGAFVGVDLVEAPEDDAEPPSPALILPPVRTAANGRFVVLAKDAAQVVVVAGGTGEGAPAVSRPIAVHVGARQDVGDVVLGRVEHLRGRVVGADSLPRVRASVWATRLGARRHLYEYLVRTSTGAVQGDLLCEIGEREEFDLAGVDGGPWLVTAQARDWRGRMSHEVRRRESAIVRGAAEHVTLDVRRALLQVHVSDEHGPTKGALVLVEGSDAMALRTSDDGDGDVVLLPETTYRLVAWRPDRGVEGRTVTMGSSGSTKELHLTLPMPPAQMPSELAWVPTDADECTLGLRVVSWGTDGTCLPATLRVLDARGEVVPTTWVERDGQVSWLIKDGVRTWGEIWLTTRLAPGDYTLEAEVPCHRTRRVPVTIGPDGKGPRNVEVRMVPR